MHKFEKISTVAIVALLAGTVAQTAFANTAWPS